MTQPSPLEPEEIPELGRFLARGFGRPDGSVPFSEDVLRWKYFEPLGVETGPRSFVVREDGPFLGHIGVCPRVLTPPPGTGPSVSSAHPIDWIASKDKRGTGLALMRQVFEGSATQYAMGGTEVAKKVQTMLGYETASRVRAYFKVLRPSYRLRGPGNKTFGRLARFGNDVARAAARIGRGPRRLDAVRVDRFGPEVDALVAGCECPAGFTTRSAGLLNYYLRFPRKTFTGWTLHDGPRPAGFALLNLVRAGGVVNGRLVECFLTRPEARDWGAAVAALTHELAGQGADYVTCLASTPWMEGALRANGFAGRPAEDFRVRDPGRALPAGMTVHVTQLEADHGYL